MWTIENTTTDTPSKTGISMSSLRTTFGSMQHHVIKEEKKEREERKERLCEVGVLHENYFYGEHYYAADPVPDPCYLLLNV